MNATKLSDTAILRSQVEVLSIAESFFQSSVLFALAKLRVFELIGEGERTLEELGAALGAQPETLARLLTAGVALNLLETEKGSSFRVAPVARPVLLPSSGNSYLGDWIRNMDFFRSALSGLDDAVMNSGPTVDPASHLGADKQRTRQFAMAMHNASSFRGKELAHFLDTKGANALLDLGCGPGTYAFCLGLKNPGLRLYLLDFPETLEVSKEIQATYSLQNEVHYLPLDAAQDEIPGSYDLILVSNTLHMLGEAASRQLIQRLYASINKGGSLVIQAQFFRDDMPRQRWPIFMDLIQLCTTVQGRNHSVGETQRWLEEAGFCNLEFRSMSPFNTNSFLRGYKA
jgi:SAM-dependent methyltransferase